jgi:hypothetical protein
MTPKNTYSEPTVLWRLKREDGRKARALVVPRGFDTCAAVFINERPEDVKDFKEREDALRWLEMQRSCLHADGWQSPD